MMVKPYAYFKYCLHAEVLRKKPSFSWRMAIYTAIINREKRFYFFWRLAEFLHQQPKRFSHWMARRIATRLYYRYGCDIELGTRIGPGLRIRHFSGIVINKHTFIGANCTLRQNTTIGAASASIKNIIIGNNVSIGANVCIIGDDIHIGNNVTIGAAAFINKSISENCVCYSRNQIVIREKHPNERFL